MIAETTNRRLVGLSMTVALATTIAAALAGGCGAAGSADSPAPRGGFGGKGGASFGGGLGGRFAPGGATGQDNRPPEAEVEASFQVPVATGRFVWVANPTSGRVAYIDAATLAVKTAEAGNAPTALAVIPGAADEVIVLNVLSHDATVLQAAAGQLTRTMVAGVAPLANAWAISPDGRFALAWTDTRVALANPARQKSLEGFQDLTAIDLAARPPTATTLAVGYRPVSITFSADGAEAYVVTGDGISVLGLQPASGAVQVVRDIPLTADATETADTRDVSVTRAGRAVVRHEGSADVGIVDLGTGALGTVTLSGPVTDVDVTPDGTRAIAVVRETSEIAILPLATAVSNPATILRETIDGEVIGSAVLTADGAQAVLFSNAVDAERLTVVDLVSGTYRTVRVHAPVLAVVPSPDGKYAVVLHRAAAAAPTVGAGGAGGAPVAAAVGPSNAFSVIPLDGSRSGRIQETTAPPNAVALAPGSDRALVTVRDDRGATYGAYVVGIPALNVTPIVLASPPIATGVAKAANRGYVAQSYGAGRITFIPFDGTPPQTLTGFDLGARVVDGVSP